MSIMPHYYQMPGGWDLYPLSPDYDEVMSDDGLDGKAEEDWYGDGEGDEDEDEEGDRDEDEDNEDDEEYGNDEEVETKDENEGHHGGAEGLVRDVEGDNPDVPHREATPQATSDPALSILLTANVEHMPNMETLSWVRWIQGLC